MQFSVVALIATSAALVSAAANATVTALSTTLVTLDECPETVTNCPYRSTSVLPSNYTASNVSTYEGAGVRVQFAAGAAALAAGALLAL